MATVSVNPPKTPVTKGSSGIAAATLPNVCKMPGPPAPFVPTPLPNIGKSGDSPKGYSKKVKVEGQPVAIKGASFKSMGDIASKGTGGGLVSSNTHGPTKFIGPGSFDVKIEGKSVQYLGDPMVNNCGSPANSATTPGEVQGAANTTTADYRCPGHEVGGEPRFPQTEESFKDRRNALAKDQSPGGQHEHKAAIHNEPDILRLEGSLNRGQGVRRSALSGKAAEHQVVHTCKHCGAPLDGEIEHATEDRQGRRQAVEAKSGADFNPAKSPSETRRNVDQMRRLRSLSESSAFGVVYKLPNGHNKAASQIQRTASQLGFPPGQPQIIFI